MNFEEKASNMIRFSEKGSMIGAGEIYFEGELLGRTMRFTSLEYEKFLGLRDVSTKERKTLAKEGKALPDGSFPIANCKDAANAIHAIGRANPSDRGKVRAHIKKRVKALGCSGSTFDNWK